MKKAFCLFSFLLMGCFQITSQDQGLRTVPVTNNPQLIPQNNSILPSPGMNPSSGIR
ncbi:MAG: hypothetical protein WCP39_03025 [Chlamydiota bacterium]